MKRQPICHHQSLDIKLLMSIKSLFPSLLLLLLTWYARICARLLHMVCAGTQVCSVQCCARSLSLPLSLCDPHLRIRHCVRFPWHGFMSPLNHSDDSNHNKMREISRELCFCSRYGRVVSRPFGLRASVFVCMTPCL